MKKILTALLIVIVAAVAAVIGIMALKFSTGTPIINPLINKPKPEIGVMKPIYTQADVMDELGYAMTQNTDTVGWLKIPNTEINNSVLQSHNNVYYLRLNEKKEEDVYGCYFADYECSFGKRDSLSQNTIIYGHSDLKDNPDGPKFSQLFKFTDEQFATNNPYIYFSTIEDYMVWQVFAVFYTDTGMEYIMPDLSEEVLTALVNEAKLKSIYNYDVAVAGKDKILTLSTCTVKYGARKDQRLVIMAKLIPENEKEEPKASLSLNPKPMEPQFK